ncbi:hypothetical protein RJ55_03659 [Drechmeria coniospora]|nr:hypothetical protein RJ55_03659 [Drechmeria coniospora]
MLEQLVHFSPQTPPTQWSILAERAILAVLPATRPVTALPKDLLSGEGHMSRDCSEPLKENKSCYKVARARLPNATRQVERAELSSDGRLTTKQCGEVGHIARNCNKAGFGGGAPYGGGAGGPGGYGGGAGKTCYSCGGYGHMSRECVNGMKCYNCGESGHYSRDCPKESAGGEKICYKCQQGGHVQAQCPN